MDAKQLPVVFLMGPTASGKTDLATQLYEELNCELVSVDAAQIFRGMNIGTAKPDQAFLSNYPHHLIDIRNPDEPYSAAEFRRDAVSLISDIHGRGKLPIFVGGTMFYFSALEKGLSDLPAASDVIRAEISEELEQKGLLALHRELVDYDPGLANRIQPNDQQRTLRALEIARITGLPPSVVMEKSKAVPLANPVIKMTLFNADRKELHARIKLRFEMMLEQGLIDEVETLLATFPGVEKMPSMKIVGYRQPIDYLMGRISQDQMVLSSIAATRQLAKRQLTWLRQQSNVVWFEVEKWKTEKAVASYLNSNPLITQFP